MKFDKQTYEAIEKYLDGSMSSEALLAFEAKKNTNQALAREVQLVADLQESLADSPENNLRKNLQFLNNEYQEDRDDSNNTFRYLLWLLPIILATGWWLFTDSNSNSNSFGGVQLVAPPSAPTTETEITPTENTNEPSEEIPPTPVIKVVPKPVPQEDFKKTLPDSYEVTPKGDDNLQEKLKKENRGKVKKKVIAQRIEQKKKPTNQKKTDESKEIKKLVLPEPQLEEQQYGILESADASAPLPVDAPASPPLAPPASSSTAKSITRRTSALDFLPNSKLESLRKKNRNQSKGVIEIDKRPQSFNLESPNQAASFILSGILKSTAEVSNQDFKVHTFSNQPSDFKRFKTIASHHLTLQKMENAYRFNFQKNLSLSPGLYYFLIEEVKSKKIYFVEKFVVKSNF